MSFDSIASANLASALVSQRPTIRGTRYAVSAGHYLATQAAFAIVEKGGNVTDAGVAAGLVLAVVQSEYVNFAGVAPIMIRDGRTGAIEVVAGLGHWPKAANLDVFIERYGETMPPGILRTVIPAAPDAYITALERHGTMPFGEVARSAIRLACDGFVMYPLMADLVGSLADEYRKWPSNAAIYLPGGSPPKTGDIFVQSDLGRTIQYMADEEKAATRNGRAAGLAAARDAFYRGDIAQAILSYHREHEGWLTTDDLASYRSDVEPAVTRRVFGLDVHTAQPWCQGPVLIQMLKILDGMDLRALGHNSADYIHAVLEAMKWAFNDRERHFRDPRLHDVPLDWLLSDQRANEHRSAIRMDQAYIDPTLGELGRTGSGTPSLDTSYAAVIDREGNAFTVVPSDVSYDTPVIPGTGLCPSSRGGQSWTRRGHPSAVEPGARPRLTPNPVLVTGDDLTIAIGTPGGDVQPQAVLQTLLNMRLFGMELQQAVEAPRFATYSFPDSFVPHDYAAGVALLEAGLAGQAEELGRRGHQITLWPAATFRAGGVCVAMLEKRTGVLSGAADPRRPCYALGW